jgi:hypothetical protein
VLSRLPGTKAARLIDDKELKGIHDTEVQVRIVGPCHHRHIARWGKDGHYVATVVTANSANECTGPPISHRVRESGGFHIGPRAWSLGNPRSGPLATVPLMPRAENFLSNRLIMRRPTGRPIKR